MATSASSVQLDIARDRGDEKAQLVKFSEKSSQCAVQNRHNAPGHGPGCRDQHNMKIQPRIARYVTGTVTPGSADGLVSKRQPGPSHGKSAANLKILTCKFKASISQRFWIFTEFGYFGKFSGIPDR